MYRDYGLSDHDANFWIRDENTWGTEAQWREAQASIRLDGEAQSISRWHPCERMWEMRARLAEASRFNQKNSEAIAMNKTFWILWAPSAKLPPTHKFSTYVEALKTARRMCKDLNIGKMYVLRVEAEVTRHEEFVVEDYRNA